MVNGLCLYSSSLEPVATESALQRCLKFTQSYAHEHTDGSNGHAGRQPARLEQSRLGAMLSDDTASLSTRLGGAGDRTSDLAVTSQPALPLPDLLPPICAPHVVYVDDGLCIS